MTTIKTLSLYVLITASLALNTFGKPVAPRTLNRRNVLPTILTGADQTQLYLNYLKGKNIGMVVNPTSIIGKNKTSLVDSLLKLGINIKKVYGPEHGFRGDASNGAKIDDAVDAKTGLPVISLYGKHYKPTPADLNGIDLLIFDIQDVGVRFYTYISTLHYVMEACAENNIELMVLDRPNPNGTIIDGPILDTAFRSFVGMHQIPIAHGMTIGEYAQMINGEHWLKNGIQCKLRIIKMANYKHAFTYTLPVNPSPNLNTAQSILLYPSVCLFEGTTLSLGRGTLLPFLQVGHPLLKGKYSFSFKPVSIPGMSEDPPQKNQICYGINLKNYDTNIIKNSGHINLLWLIELYKAFPDKAHFFNAYFTKLAGTDRLQKQIEAGMTEAQIRRSWEPGLAKFKATRHKYLLYQ
ncbi:exo-beta-N-acetylmuramidase NamZ domain-containing protein [Mucilaginibacter ximonensis]|uniref:Exo-beta-N-acetylmuramidase NamZ domain-containing protein n=1 Tax=Mucilaginibacter ximonensis TaxID=538021 RepID=A0ABW5YGP4_9SPHI